MHPAYKHLTDRLKIAELTVPQIAGLFAGLMCGLVFALYLSPFSSYLTLCLSIYIASVPAGTVLLATSTEFDLWLYVKACVGEHSSCGRFTAGPGAICVGYSVTADDHGEHRSPRNSDGSIDLGNLWVS